MLGFPLPYPQELLYSVIGRAGVHDGETSPKQLLSSVFGNRKVIATADLPSHIDAVTEQYPEEMGITSDSLITDHTLWPLYAPFIPSRRRKTVEQWMKQESRGAVHLATGIAASRIKHKLALHMCPSCFEEQMAKYGEVYWDRCWQFPLIKLCEKHGALYQTDILLNGDHRHAYIPASDFKGSYELIISDIDKRFAGLVLPLLQGELLDSPTYHQWTVFYQELSKKYGYKLSKRTNHDLIGSRYLKSWKFSWLRKAGLIPGYKDTSWLRTIFRKHRKSFSFAEHITVIDALSEGELGIIGAIEHSLSYPAEEPIRKKFFKVVDQTITEDHELWMRLVSQFSPKVARGKNPALYTRLYRKSYGWLMEINARAKSRVLVSLNNRVNWNDRDRLMANQLRQIILQSEDNLSLPRLSRTFLLHQLEGSASIEKNLSKLPRCRTILKFYSESIFEYQVRRLTLAVLSGISKRRQLKRWSLLRQAGLSDERITDIADKFLKWVLKEWHAGKLISHINI